MRLNGWVQEWDITIYNYIKTDITQIVCLRSNKNHWTSWSTLDLGLIWLPFQPGPELTQQSTKIGSIQGGYCQGPKRLTKFRWLIAQNQVLGTWWALGVVIFVILTHFHLWDVTPGTLYNTPGFRTELQFCMPQSPLWEHDHSMNHVAAVSKNHIPRHYITTYYHFKRRTYMIGNRDTWVDTQFWDIDRTCRGALKRSSSQFQGTSPERSLQHEHS